MTSFWYHMTAEARVPKEHGTHRESTKHVGDLIVERYW